MSGGGGAQPTGSQFPAPAVSGLWQQAEQGFQPFPYPNTAGAANNAYGKIGSGFTTNAGSWNPQMQGSFGGQALDQGSSWAVEAQNLGEQVAPFVDQTLATGFDPQQKLFNQLFNQQQQQGLAGQAAAGVANTPYGAGLSEQGNQNFDIAWQNAQLARQGQAAQNAQALEGIPAQAVNAANQFLGTGANLGMGAGNFLNNLNQQQIQDYLSYLGANTNNAAQMMQSINNSLNAGTNLYGTGGQLNQAANNANALGLQGLGSLAGELGTVALLA